MRNPRVFISHSSKDVKLAEGIVYLLRAALPLRPEEIRCTSIEGHRLPSGVSTDVAIRKEILECDVLIALLSEHSLRSIYVAFELGARWGAGKPLYPVLASSIHASDLEQPLSLLNARDGRSRAEMLQLLENVAETLQLTPHSPSAYDKALSACLEQIGVGKAKAKSESINPSDQTARATTNLTGRDICQRIRAAPPLQQRKVSSEFVNAYVDWETLYSSADHLEDSDMVSIILRPWEDDGADCHIRCQVALADYPMLKELPSQTPIRVCGRIRSLEPYVIQLDEVSLFVLSDQERQGTRVRWLVPVIESIIGREAASQATVTGIINAVKAQVTLGCVNGIRLNERGHIVPEIDKYSDPFRLLALHTSKQLVETFGSKMRDKLFSLENDIYKLENKGY